MKKILFLTAVSAFTAFSVSAQISKGSTYLGGTLGFNTSKSTTETSLSTAESKATTINVSPSIGFAYNENRVWGLLLNYAYTKNTPNEYKANSFGVGAFLRQYKPLGKGFYLFAQEDATLAYSTLEQGTANVTETKSYGIDLGISPGFAYDISKKFQLEIVLNDLLYAGYTHSKAEPKAGTLTPYKNTTNSFGAGSNLSNLASTSSLTIGARYVFGR